LLFFFFLELPLLLFNFPENLKTYGKNVSNIERVCSPTTFLQNIFRPDKHLATLRVRLHVKCPTLTRISFNMTTEA
jgi:hypothetical protein